MFPPETPMRQEARTAIAGLLAECAESPPTSAQVAGRPRRRITRPASAAVAVAVVTAGGVIAAITVGGGSTPAWSATPRSVPDDVKTRLAEACEENIAAGRLPIALRPPLRAVAEARGSSYAVVLADSASQGGICISSPHRTWPWREAGIYQLKPSDEILTVDAVPGVVGGANPARAAFGRVAADVATVVIETRGGLSVTATVEQGFFLGWWPSGDVVRRVTARSTSGALLATVWMPPDPDPAPTRSPS